MRTFILSLLLLPVLGASLRADLPASTLRLKANLENVLNERQSELATDLGHFGLVFQPTQEMLRASLQQVEAREHRGGFVLTRGPYFSTANYPARESHGGTLLNELLGFWQPNGRKALLQDRYAFANGPRVLDTIYLAHKKQLFIPPIENGAAPSFPVMLLPFASEEGRTVVEPADSYQVLLLVIDNTAGGQFGDEWMNLVNQPLSVDRLVEQVRTAYLEDRQPGRLPGDHTSYHALEILVRHAQKSPAMPSIQAIKRRFLEVELSETELLKNDAVRDALLSHYIQALGYLLSYERLALSAQEKMQITRWLDGLAGYFPERLAQVANVHELAHALHGLRLIQQHAGKLE